METPDSIWLINQGADGVCWHDSPNPSGNEQPEDVCHYVKADNVQSQLDQYAEKNAQLSAMIDVLQQKLTLVEQVLHDAPELNMCNYHHDDVGKLNTAAIEAYSILVSS